LVKTPRQYLRGPERKIIAPIEAVASKLKMTPKAA